MIGQAIGVILAVGIVAALDIIQYTHGRGGGEICGRHHLCHSDANCELLLRRGQALKMCVCQNQLVGNGLLHCKPSTYKAVYIQNDPHMKNFFQEFAGLKTPCRYRAVRLEMFTPENVTAKVELFGENLLYSFGEYFLTRLTLSIEVSMGKDSMKQIKRFYGDVSKSGNYTLVCSDIENLSMLVEGKTDFNGYTMDVGKDDINNLLKVTVKKLGITLLFRPPSSRREIDNTKNPMVPGAVFIVDDEHWPYVHVDESRLELSSWPNGPSLSEAAGEMNTSKPIFVHYLMLNNSLPDPTYTDEVCTETSRFFREECRLDSIRLKMLHKCTPIYADQDFLKLVSQNDVDDKYTILLKRFFLRCEIAFCRRNVTLCQAMVDDMKAELKDHMPKHFENLDCEAAIADIPHIPVVDDSKYHANLNTVNLLSVNTHNDNKPLLLADPVGGGNSKC